MNSPKKLAQGLPPSVDRLFVMACSALIAASLVAISGMLLAAFAFASAVSISIPFVARFEGFLDDGGSSAVTISGSWIAVGTVTLILAVALSVVALRALRTPATPVQAPGSQDA